MPSNRGYNSLTASSRLKLIEAASELLGEQGYHAISARRIAERAGLKPQLVHYYFRSMEELVVAVFLKATEVFQARHDQALLADNPLRALWDLNRHENDSKRITEYIALSKGFPILREEMRKSGEHFRKLQTAVITDLFARRKLANPPISPAALGMMLAALARNFVIEGECGITGAHAEMYAMVDSVFKLFDPANTTDAAADLRLADPPLARSAA